VIFEVLSAVFVKIQVSWIVTPFRPADN